MIGNRVRFKAADLEKRLVLLGLKKREVNIYLHLLQNSSLTAVQLADKLYVSPSAVYRPLTNLEKLGLIYKLNLPKTQFVAVEPKAGLENLLNLKLAEFSQVKQEILPHLSRFKSVDKYCQIKTFYGKSAMFDRYVYLAKSAQKQLLIVSLGEIVGEEIILANRDACWRGVKIMFISQRLTRFNYDLLHSYIQMGWAVKHCPESGYHLVVVDQKHVLLAVNNPTQTDQRVVVEFDNESLGLAFSRYFMNLWQRASEIEESNLEFVGN